MAVLLSVGGAYALASWDWCPRTGGPAPKIVSRLQASGSLEAGAAAVELTVPYPIVAAGYGPPRPVASSAAAPLMARAIVLREGDVTFGLVAVDLLLVPGDLADEVRAKSGLGDAWVVATHSHSSLGGYDSRWVAQLAGTGRFRADARDAVVGACVAALKAAAAKLVPVTASTGEGTTGFSAPRSGTASDPRLIRLQLGDVARLELVAAHPTLVPRPAAALHPDYPGLLAARADAGVSLVLQTAGGNARAEGASSPEDLAQKLGAELDALALAPLEQPALSVTRVELAPPPPDASRLVPRFFAMPGRNFLCASGPARAEVGVLKLGTFELVALPAEVTLASAQSLGAPVLSLANGYLGYVEPAASVEKNEGESKRQYYDPTLLDAFRAAIAIGR